MSRQRSKDQSVATTKPWTEKHCVAALRRIYELAAEFVTEGRDPGRIGHLLTFALFCSQNESRFRDFLANAQFVSDRHTREVRLVRARAEGRVVVTVKTCWCVKLARGGYLIDNCGATMRLDDRDEATEYADMRPGLRRVVKVTLTRRRIARGKGTP